MIVSVGGLVSAWCSSESTEDGTQLDVVVLIDCLIVRGRGDTAVELVVTQHLIWRRWLRL